MRGRVADWQFNGDNSRPSKYLWRPSMAGDAAAAEAVSLNGPNPACPSRSEADYGVYPAAVTKGYPT